MILRPALKTSLCFHLHHKGSTRLLQSIGIDCYDQGSIRLILSARKYASSGARSAHTESDNAPAQKRVWTRDTN